MIPLAIAVVCAVMCAAVYLTMEEVARRGGGPDVPLFDHGRESWPDVHWRWTRDVPKPGLYAVAYTFGQREGVYPTVATSDGTRWADVTLPVVGHSVLRFAVEADAARWIAAHDPEAANNL
jgi:hypothetical protein